MFGAILAATMLHSPPKWFDLMLAGYEFAYDLKHADISVYDAGSDYSMFREAVCDGADLTLELTPGPRDGSASGRPQLQKKLPNLSTGKGVKIGMSAKQVEGILGKPAKTDSTTKGVSKLVYVWVKGSGTKKAREFTESYSLAKDKLIAVTFEWHLAEQGGGSGSDKK